MNILTLTRECWQDVVGGFQAACGLCAWPAPPPIYQRLVIVKFGFGCQLAGQQHYSSLPPCTRAPERQSATTICLKPFSSQHSPATPSPFHHSLEPISFKVPEAEFLRKRSEEEIASGLYFAHQLYLVVRLLPNLLRRNVRKTLPAVE